MNGWNVSVELVEDKTDIQKNGRQVVQIDAFGCTSRGQAYRKYASEHGLEIGNRKAGLLLRDQWERVTYVSGVDVLYKIRTLNANTLASGGKMIPDIKHPMYSPSVVGFVGPYSHAIPLFIVNTANGSGVALKNNSYTLRDVLIPAFSGTSLVYGEEGELGGICLTKDPLIVLDADDYFE